MNDTVSQTTEPQRRRDPARMVGRTASQERELIIAWLRDFAKKEREYDRFSGLDDHTKRIARLIEDGEHER